MVLGYHNKANVFPYIPYFNKQFNITKTIQYNKDVTIKVKGDVSACLLLVHTVVKRRQNNDFYGTSFEIRRLIIENSLKVQDAMVHIIWNTKKLETLTRHNHRFWD